MINTSNSRKLKHMKLSDLDKKNAAKKALKENFSLQFNTHKLSLGQTRNMLSKVRGLLHETKKTPTFYKAQNNPGYLKLIFMEQALSSHLSQLLVKKPRIVFENEEVEKSQVILAAQDMVDTVQKMYEDINDMLVKELPALVDSIQSEIGENESTQFNQQVSESLNGLNSTLLESKNTLQMALNGLTGQGGMDSFDGGDDMGLGGPDDLDGDLSGDLDIGGEEDDVNLPPIPDMDAGPEELPEPKLGHVGRPKR